jgi:ribonuclease G
VSEELLINVNDFESRVALVSGSVVEEVQVARAGADSLTGNIYLGRVQRIIPGMQAAFVECGLERPGFLHVNDIAGPRLMLGEEPDGAVDIRELLHDGQRLMVQVAKDPIASKGARLTTQLTIASRYLVLMPFSDHIGVSQRVDQEDERERLRLLVDEVRGGQDAGVGFIVRTAADGVAREPLEADVRVLLRIWDRIMARRAECGCPGIVYEELPLHTRVIRDMATANLERIRIDHLPTLERVRTFVSEFLPELTDRVVLYDEPRPIFERFGVDDELTRALGSRVELKSGGHLVIEQTEAMTTVDVNTGAYLGKHNLEETVFRTNLEAAQVLPRQLRLRNLGGIIVVDFIDMEDEEHRRQVLRTLEKACEGDPARIRIEGFSSLGLVQMSRKRTRESLVQQLCEPCSHCHGAGVVKTAQSTCIEIFRSIMQDAESGCGGHSEGDYVIRAAGNVVDRLLDEDAGQLAAMAARVGRRLRIELEPSYGAGEFDIVLVGDTQ